MKPGTIVVCISDFSEAKAKLPHMVLPVKDAFYTVREFYRQYESIALEEIKDQFINSECGLARIVFKAEFFREVEFPPALEAEIKEILTAPVLVEA